MLRWVRYAVCLKDRVKIVKMGHCSWFRLTSRLNKREPASYPVGTRDKTARV
jgi:hypothetical protein